MTHRVDASFSHQYEQGEFVVNKVLAMDKIGTQARGPHHLLDKAVSE